MTIPGRFSFVRFFVCIAIAVTGWTVLDAGSSDAMAQSRDLSFQRLAPRRAAPEPASEPEYFEDATPTIEGERSISLPRPRPEFDVETALRQVLPGNGADNPARDGTFPGPLTYAPAAPNLSGIYGDGELVLEARLASDGPPLKEGVVWRIFSQEPGESGEHDLIATASGGVTSIALNPGSYLVHAGFGRSGATKKINYSGEGQSETIVLNAGGLRLDAVVGDDIPVADDLVRFEISQIGPNGERVLVVPNSPAGLINRLKAGTYHVVSYFGRLNAVVRADIEVKPDSLTEATIRHKAAEVTLKLVAAEGSEALANTVWTVLTQSGDTIHESVGAYPKIVLAEGPYTAVAQHNEQIYSRDFEISSGLPRDIEVLLTDQVNPSVLSNR